MLTTAQLAALKTDIQGQAALTSAVAAQDWVTVANFYNTATATQLWRPNVGSQEIIGAANWTAFATCTVQQQNTFLAMLLNPTVDATKANIRAGFAAVFTVAADQNALSAIAQRAATRLEVLFGSGGPPIVSAVFGYTIPATEVQKAMGF